MVTNPESETIRRTNPEKGNISAWRVNEIEACPPAAPDRIGRVGEWALDTQFSEIFLRLHEFCRAILIDIHPIPLI